MSPKWRMLPVRYVAWRCWPRSPASSNRPISSTSALAGAREPRGGKQVVEPAKDPVSEVELLHVVDPRAALDLLDVEPGVKAARHTVLEHDVDGPGSPPAVPGDHGAPQSAQKLPVLAGDHPVGEVGQLGDPDHLGVRLDVLGRIEHEVKSLVRAHATCDRRSLTSYHRATPSARPFRRRRPPYPSNRPLPRVRSARTRRQRRRSPPPSSLCSRGQRKVTAHNGCPDWHAVAKALAFGGSSH